MHRALRSRGRGVVLVAISLEELQLAARNHAMPLEALRWPLTPIGLHYVLVHYDIPVVDAATWRLAIDGHVATPLSLSLDDLRELEPVEVVTTMECAGNGRARLEPRPISQPWLVEAVGTARWRGVAWRSIATWVAPRGDAAEAVFTGLDRGIEGGVAQTFARSLPLGELDDAVLAYEMNGQPLPPQHGFPLRLVIPGWYGMTNVKWLARIDVVDRPFDGYQQAVAYRWRHDENDDGTPLTRMAPRSLLAPPGVPEFFSRVRTLPAGPCRLEGRAWSGHAPVAGVRVSTDGGETWADAKVAPDELGSRWAWRGWHFDWDAQPGQHLVGCRARDECGNEQPLDPPWNVGGYANNAPHWVRVNVEPAPAA